MPTSVRATASIAMTRLALLRPIPPQTSAAVSRPPWTAATPTIAMTSAGNACAAAIAPAAAHRTRTARASIHPVVMGTCAASSGCRSAHTTSPDAVLCETDERVDHFNIEPVSCLRAEKRPRVGVGHRLTVGAVRRQGVVDVGHRDDTRADRDGLAGEAIGIAASVHALVVVADDRGARREELERRHDLRADEGVAPHERPLL